MIKFTAAALAMAMLFSGPVFAHPGNEACVSKAQLSAIANKARKWKQKNIQAMNNMNTIKRAVEEGWHMHVAVERGFGSVILDLESLSR